MNGIGEDAVQCFPHDGWWVLHYNGPVRPVSHFIDITTQPRLTRGRMEMIDLDLLVLDDGTVQIVDEDEFEANQVVLDYDRATVEQARAETERVARLLRTCEEPFFEVAETWLQMVVTVSFPDPGTDEAEAGQR